MPTLTRALFRGAATTTLTTTLYTVPSATTTVVSNIVITNTATSAATFDLSLNGVKLADATAIAADSIVVIDLKQVIAATQTIQGGASATTVNFHISGVEISYLVFQYFLNQAVVAKQSIQYLKNIILMLNLQLQL